MILYKKNFQALVTFMT